MSAGWNFYIVALTAINLIGLIWLLLATAAKPKNDKPATETMGHVWDGDIEELNNPLPRWWFILFILTFIFGFAYLALYPGLGTFKGSLGWSSGAEVQAELDATNAKLETLFAGFRNQPLADLIDNPAATKVGRNVFANNCAACHGSDARGAIGYPNLVDGDWLYGGTHDKILETLQKGRIGNMPPMAAAVGSPEDVRNLSHYVLSLSGSPHDSLRASLGKSKFGACAACHGMDGKGNQALGAPNLTDDIWLHGWGEAAITAMINNGKVNQMPAQADKLTEAQIKVLASYVWGLSNNKAQ